MAVRQLWHPYVAVGARAAHVNGAGIVAKLLADRAVVDEGGHETPLGLGGADQRPRAVRRGENKGRAAT